MRIVEIEVEQLFGTFDHRIPLNIDDRITLIHGPNGFGKTILLEMLYGLFNGRYSVLRKVPFQELVVRFDDGGEVSVRQGPPAEPADLGFTQKVFELKIGFLHGDGKAEEGREFRVPLPDPPPIQGMAELLEKPHVELIGDDTWVDTSTGEVVWGSSGVRVPPWWRVIQQSVGIEIIREQRLTRISKPKNRRPARPAPEWAMPTIAEYSTELAATLEKKLAESVTLSQSLDRTFPIRLLERIHAQGPTENELSAKLERLERKREQLTDAGLLAEQGDMPLPSTEKLAAETRDMLAVYVEDAEKKLGVFEDLARKIELFQDIVNSRFLYKKLAISRQSGFVVTTCTGEPLPLGALSSGEQQEMVLLYELLFRLEPDSLVLIDEPEISLHVDWQNEFLEDLAKITELASFDVLIATHSPELIHKRWDLTVELRSPKVEAEVETVP